MKTKTKKQNKIFLISNNLHKNKNIININQNKKLICYIKIIKKFKLIIKFLKNQNCKKILKFVKKIKGKFNKFKN